MSAEGSVLSKESKQHYDSYVNLVNTTLDEFLTMDSKYYQIVSDAMRYSVENGGKRLRPVLLLEFCRVCGGNLSDALPYACALEMIHTYSLIHDDLPCMDNDDYRRGKESCHKKFGYEYALLAGDALLTYAFKIASDAGVRPGIAVKCIRYLSNYAGICGMIGGQTMDIKNEQNPKLTLDELEITHKKKTGALIRSACEIGCTLGEATPEEFASATEYAENLGLAFQIVDDILDVVGDPKVLGKGVGIDAENGKVTYVTLLGLEGAKELAKEYTDKALKSLDNFENNGFLKELTLKLLTRNK